MQREATTDLLVTILSGARKDAPDWVQLFPFGRVETTKGPFVASEADALACIEAFKRLGRDLVIDYEHQTLKGVEAPAAGWVHRLELREDGLWARVSWTERAAAHIQAREYRYLSPVLWHRRVGGERHPFELGPVGLTNDPAIIGMPALYTAHEPAGAGKEEAMIEKLRQLLGLKDGAPEDELHEGVKGLVALKARAVALGEKLGVKDLDQVEGLFAELDGLRAYKAQVVDALGLEASSDASQAKGTILALKNVGGTHAALAVEVAQLKAAAAERLAIESVDAALAEGKLTPAQRAWGLDLARKDHAAFEAYRKAAPQIVASGRVAQAQAAASSAHGLSEGELRVAEAMGLSPEAYRKHNAEA